MEVVQEIGVMSGRMNASYTLAESAMLKKSGQRKAESG